MPNADDHKTEAHELSFEEALQQVEQLVRTMENTTLPLNETLAAFEKGIRLARFCQEYLDAAEQRIEQIIAQNGTPTLIGFTLAKDERDD